MLVPLAVAGAMRLAQSGPGRIGLAAVAIANALIPAAHAILNIQIPILPMRAEWALLQSPQPPYASQPYLEAALQAMRNNQKGTANKLLSIGTRLAPDSAISVLTESIFLWENQRGTEAMEKLALWRNSHSFHPEVSV